MREEPRTGGWRLPRIPRTPPCQLCRPVPSALNAALHPFTARNHLTDRQSCLPHATLAGDAPGNCKRRRNVDPLLPHAFGFQSTFHSPPHPPFTASLSGAGLKTSSLRAGVASPRENGCRFHGANLAAVSKSRCNAALGSWNRGRRPSAGRPSAAACRRSCRGLSVTLSSD